MVSLPLIEMIPRFKGTVFMSFFATQIAGEAGTQLTFHRTIR